MTLDEIWAMVLEHSGVLQEESDPSAGTQNLIDYASSVDNNAIAAGNAGPGQAAEAGAPGSVMAGSGGGGGGGGGGGMPQHLPSPNFLTNQVDRDRSGSGRGAPGTKPLPRQPDVPDLPPDTPKLT